MPFRSQTPAFAFLYPGDFDFRPYKPSSPAFKVFLQPFPEVRLSGLGDGLKSQGVCESDTEKSVRLQSAYQRVQIQEYATFSRHPDPKRL
jgi:hypothetical protein